MPRKSKSELDTYVGARPRMRRLMQGLSLKALGKNVTDISVDPETWKRDQSGVSQPPLRIGTTAKRAGAIFFDGLKSSFRKSRTVKCAAMCWRRSMELRTSQQIRLVIFA